MMDNLGSHKGLAERLGIEAVGAKLRYLPPHSPVSNPIKNTSSQLKHHLRRASARTHENVCNNRDSPLDPSSTPCA